jgi:hypothetical protein
MALLPVNGPSLGYGTSYTVSRILKTPQNPKQPRTNGVNGESDGFGPK